MLMKKALFVMVILSIFLSACGVSPKSKTKLEKAPQFTLPNALGGNVSLNDFSGRPVLLLFHMAVG